MNLVKGFQFLFLTIAFHSLTPQGVACEASGSVSDFDAVMYLCVDLGKTLTKLSKDDIDNLISNSSSALSTNVRHALQNSYVKSVRSTQMAGDQMQHQANNTMQATKLYVSRSKAATGRRLSQIPLRPAKSMKTQPPLSPYEEALLKPAECHVSDKDATVDDLPLDLRVSYARKNASRLAEYSDLVINGPDVSGFCQKHIRSLTTAEGILNSKTIRPYTPVSPLNSANFKTSILTSQGKLIRHISNKFQVAWIERDGYRYAEKHVASSYLTGVALLKSADSHFYSKDYKLGFNLAKASEVMLNISLGLVDGLIKDGAKTLIEAIPILADASFKLSINIAAAQLDPSYAREYFPKLAEQIITNIPIIFDQVVEGILADYETLVEGDVYSRSRLLGRVVFETTLDYLTGGGARTAATGKMITTKSARILESKPLKELATKTFDSLNYFDEIRDNTLSPRLRTKRIQRKAERFKRVHQRLIVKGSELTPKSKNYLSHLIANNGRYGLPLFSDEDLLSLVDQYHNFEAAATSLKTSTFSGQIHRMIPKQVKVKGELMDIHPSKIFENHPAAILANGRVSMPGRGALYTTIGKDFTEIQDVLMKEIGAIDDQRYWKGSMNFNATNILDLSPQTVDGFHNLSQLNINANDLLKKNDMLLPQALGHLLDSTNIDGIILPSRHNKSINNLVIF